MVLRTTPVDGDPLVVLDVGRLDRARVVEPLIGEQSGFDPLGELDLLLRVEERDLADLLEVVLDGIGRGARGHDLLLRLVGLLGVTVDSLLEIDGDVLELLFSVEVVLGGRRYLGLRNSLLATRRRGNSFTSHLARLRRAAGVLAGVVSRSSS